MGGGRYYTRAAKKVVRSAYRSLRNTAAGLAGTAAVKMAAKQLTKRKVGRTAKHKRMTIGSSKTNGTVIKPINKTLSKKMKRFQKKVEKVLNETSSFGRYTYVANVRLHSTTNDNYFIQYVDENNEGIYLANNYVAADAVSILFNNKTLRSAFGNTSGNLESKERFTLDSTFLKMEFKSTTNRITTVEIYECTAKENLNVGAYETMTQSVNDYVNKYSDNGVSPSTTWDFKNEGTLIQDALTLHQHYYVKKHVIVLQPGQTKVKTWKRGPKVYDPTRYLRSDTNEPFYNEKGTVQFFFRTRTNIDISGFTAPRTSGTVIAFPHENNGGVAMRYTRSIRCAPPTSGVDLAAEKSTVALGNWWIPFATNYTKQGLVQQNPISLATSV